MMELTQNGAAQYSLLTFATPVQTLYPWATRPDGNMVSCELRYTHEVMVTII